MLAHDQFSDFFFFFKSRNRNRDIVNNYLLSILILFLSCGLFGCLTRFSETHVRELTKLIVTQKFEQINNEWRLVSAVGSSKF